MNAIGRPLLFVAREPDETLRTFLPVIRLLTVRGWRCHVLFHHEPGAWVLERLDALGAAQSRVELPEQQLPAVVGWLLSAIGLGAEARELWQLWRAKRLAERLLKRIDPSAVAVIQDTLLLERFLVRVANRRGLGTVVVQWAFTFPQRYYDQLHRIKLAGGLEAAVASGDVEEPAPASEQPHGPRPSRLLQSLLMRLLGLRFKLVNSYGGGEASVFAVIGEAFREQFRQQGVRQKRIEVVGHPLHDSAFAERAQLTEQRRAELRRRYALPEAGRVVLYASQPALWRQVVTPEQLEQNLRVVGEAVRALGDDARLVLKLHPRESLEHYSFVKASDLPIVVVHQAEIAELIAVCDVFISSSSSTVLLAMMLDRPILTVNFNAVPHFDYYREVGGTLHILEHEQLGSALRAAAEDEATRTRLAEERQRVLSRLARFDGRATERLAELIVQLAGAAR
ncbi:MAG: CDP-glycerol glycerophosphotransferase family protein [Chloroflexi bacterium]|nr:CDP-glycerol glycerophosphotransferase family protein [Chloroflexota bacterium]